MTTNLIVIQHGGIEISWDPLVIAISGSIVLIVGFTLLFFARRKRKIQQWGMPEEYRLIFKNINAPGYTPDIDCYLKHGGYEALKKALAIAPKALAEGKSMSPQEQIRDDVKASGLRGRGGAGFSC